MSTGELSEEAVAYLEEKHIKSLLEELFHDVLVHLPDNPLEFLLKALEGKTSLRLMIVGPFGSGKRTQSRRIAEKYGAVVVYADDVFREEMAKDTEEGKEIARCLKERATLPNDLAAELIIRRLRMEDAVRNGWILVGFPQTRSQALHLQTAGISPVLLVMLHVSTEVAVQRCVERHEDPTVERTHRREEESSPRGVQEAPLGEDDMSLAAVVRRWKYFDARRDEITECYEPFFVSIEGDRPVDVVFDDICEQIDSRYVSV